MDIKQQTKNVASQGRYGDSMLLHVNPAEVKGLAQAVPLTINPQTGQPEAFLPFLAPILGSMAGGALLTGGALGLTLSPALAAGLGAGLATYAQTGGSGSKALLSGLTAGLGSGALSKVANPTAAATTSAATDAASQLATTVPANLGIDATTQAATQLGTDAATQLASSVPASLGIDATTQAATQLGTDAATQTANRTFMEGLTGPNTIIGDTKQIFSGGFDEGVGNLTQALMTPSGFTAAGLAGTQGIMQSQEEFEAMLARNAREQEEERQRIIAENPEMIPIATGGVTKMQEGRNTRAEAIQNNRRRNNVDISNVDEDVIQDIIDGNYNVGYDSSNYFTGDPNDLNSYIDQGYVRKREAAPIDPYFMPGFQGEATYFTNLNPSATDITSGQAPVLDTSARQAPSSMPRRFDPTQTVGYQNFYGDQAQDIVPQVVDPYAPVDFSPPPPPVLNQPSPFPTMPIAGPPTRLGDDAVEPIPSDSGVGGGMGDIGNLVPGDTGKTLTPKAQALAASPEENVDVSDYVSPNLQNMPPLDFSNLPPVDLNNLPMQDFQRNLDFDFRAEGKQLKPVPEGNKGLAKLPDDVRNTMGFMEAGGPTEIMQDPLTAQLIQFLMGEVQDDTIVGDFINKYGNEVFMQVREQVLQSIVPGSQTQGQIQGMANGGMQDDVTGMIGATQPVAVSQDEYIIPADAMSMLGDGSSDAGAKKLDAMLDRIRMTKTGTTKQAKEIDDSKVMPA